MYIYGDMPPNRVRILTLQPKSLMRVCSNQGRVAQLLLSSEFIWTVFDQMLLDMFASPE